MKKKVLFVSDLAGVMAVVDDFKHFSFHVHTFVAAINLTYNLFEDCVVLERTVNFEPIHHLRHYLVVHVRMEQLL